ncbi:MAG TPA: PIN domain-containing protein [Thermoplasmata archaeon]|nr:PIN domain-containing protein [Thermoplasmata archaeon]
MKEILDSKFLLTHYGAEDEEVLSRTRTKLAALRKERRGVLPSIVIAEVANAICQEAGRAEALAKLRALEHAGLEVVQLDPELARHAGLLKCTHRDLPMADCVIAATALRMGGRVVTNDPHFAQVKGVRTTWI